MDFGTPSMQQTTQQMPPPTRIEPESRYAKKKRRRYKPMMFASADELKLGETGQLGGA